MSDYFSGRQLMKRWGQRAFELFGLVSQGKLPPYNDIGRLTPHPYYRSEYQKNRLRQQIGFYDHAERQKNFHPVSTENTKGADAAKVFGAITQTIGSVASVLYQNELERAEGLSKSFLGWFGFRLPETKAEADKILKIVVESLYHKDEVFRLDPEFGIIQDRPEIQAPSKAKPKSVRPIQRHKEQCREAAKKLWDENPSITIADMIYRDEITKACDGKMYVDRTLRNWINDLSPNRKPGRRPQKQ